MFLSLNERNLSSFLSTLVLFQGSRSPGRTRASVMDDEYRRFLTCRLSKLIAAYSISWPPAPLLFGGKNGELLGKLRQVDGAVFGQIDHVLDPHAELALEVDTRLHGDDVANGKDIGAVFTGV